MVVRHELTQKQNFFAGERLRVIHAERKRKTSSEVLLVTAHELTHWAIGSVKGHTGDISMTPEGYSRARTIFSGNISNETLSHILAGGAVDVHGYEALGYGMDRFMVDYYSNKGGDSWEKAKIEAASAVLDFGIDVLKRGIEIMAYENSVNKQNYFTAADITHIFKRARDELVIDGQIEYLSWQLKPVEIKPEEKEMTILEDMRDEIRVVRVKKDESEEEESVCRICKKFGGEHDMELHENKQEKNINNPEENLPPDTAGTIRFPGSVKNSFPRKIPKIGMIIK